jgi:hypothetical protein
MTVVDILVKDGIKYFQTDFHGKEREVEKIVFAQYKHLFGNNAIYLRREKLIAPYRRLKNGQQKKIFQ